MGIPDYLTCLLRNLYADQEATVRTGHETKYWFQIGKGVLQGCILSPCLFNLYAEYIMRDTLISHTCKTEELMLLNCGVAEDSWESPGLQGGQTSQS